MVFSREEVALKQSPFFNNPIKIVLYSNDV